ncbi:MAG: glycosyltransferase [Gammaproteobacteria bacterium]|nr:glycosyltransferase [Gammaproteobacteria bacterium]
MIKTLILFIIALLVLFIIYAIFWATDLYYSTSAFVVQFGVVAIGLFTFIIITRYLLLLFFSMVKTIHKLGDGEKQTPTHHRVSIIVPAYNEDVVIGASIQSLLKQTYRFVEIVVLDDGSTDKTYSIAKSYEQDLGDKSVRVFTKPNGGKSRALNYGIEKSSGDLIMVVDADSKLKEDAVELLVRAFHDPDTAAVAGSVYVINRTNTLAKLQALEYIEGLNMVRNGQALLKMVNIIPDPIGVFRRSALEKVGGYDHDTFAEDCDLTLKLIAAGYKIDFEPDALAYTEAPEDLLDLIKQRYRWTRGILQAIRKHKEHLFSFRKSPSTSAILWYMLFEAIFWPFMDFWGSVFFIYLSLTTGLSMILIYWWSLFTVLDMAGAFYCLLITRDDLKLVFYALLYRLYFIGIINIAKIFATIEEWFNIEMSWGKLDRKGRL